MHSLDYFIFEGHRSSAVRAYKRTRARNETEQEMRVSDILYGVNVQKEAKEESSEDDKCAQEKKIEIKCVNENQNTKKKNTNTATKLLKSGLT